MMQTASFLSVLSEKEKHVGDFCGVSLIIMNANLLSQGCGACLTKSVSAFYFRIYMYVQSGMLRMAEFQLHLD